MNTSTKTKCYQILARDRYAQCPEGINKRQFSAVKAHMKKVYMKAWMDTPEGLYTDEAIWHQCFHHYL
jgi:hypothetical protein